MIKLKKKYKHISQIEFNEMVEVVKAHPTWSNRKLMKFTGRSSSTVNNAKRLGSWEKYLEWKDKKRQYMAEKYIPSKTVKDIGFRSEGLTLKPPSAEDNDTLDDALMRLEDAFSILKNAISDVAIAATEERIKEYKEEKEAEVKALKTVVEAAKVSNLASTLKARLMGGR